MIWYRRKGHKRMRRKDAAGNVAFEKPRGPVDMDTAKGLTFSRSGR